MTVINTVEALENGPILVKTSDGMSALCRCGQTSKEDGMCDGTHRKVGFIAPAVKYETEECSGECACSNV